MMSLNFYQLQRNGHLHSLILHNFMHLMQALSKTRGNCQSGLYLGQRSLFPRTRPSFALATQPKAHGREEVGTERLIYSFT